MSIITFEDLCSKMTTFEAIDYISMLSDEEKQELLSTITPEEMKRIDSKEFIIHGSP